MAVLSVEGLSTRLISESGWVEAIDELSLSIEPSQTFALVGESGCGKSMTALSLAGLLPDAGAVVAGKVELCGTSGRTDILRISQAQMRTVRGKRIAMIFQEPSTSLNPVMTIGEQLVEVLTLHTQCTKAQAWKEAETWLEKVGIPEPALRLKQYPFEVSGGQKQRVMIAMALAAKPDVLIADEPTTALDVLIQAQVLALLRTLQKEQGMAMLLITHDLAVVQHMADQVGLMYAGQLIEVAPCADFFKSPKHPYAHALLKALPSQAQAGKPLFALEGRVPALINPPRGCRFASRCAHRQEGCGEEGLPLVSISNKHAVRCPRHSELMTHEADQAAGEEAQAFVQQKGEAVLALNNLHVAYPKKAGLFKKTYHNVLEGVGFSLYAGQTLALVGESGSGKTTLARALLGLLPRGSKVEGAVTLKGLPLQQWPKHGVGSWRAKVQFVFQDPFASLNPRHRVSEILEEPLLSLRPDLLVAQRQARVEAMIEQVGLSQEVLKRFPHEFSGGQRQRIAIARALMLEPEVLICDEPTSALDVSVQAQILNLLSRLQRNTGVAMLFITHNLGVVRYLADQVVVLRQGLVVESGPAAQVFESPQADYTRALIESAPVLRW